MVPRLSVAAGPHGRDRALADPGALVVVKGGRRRLLEHLLVPALQRTVTLAEMDHRAVAVADQLQLDVARPVEVALDVDRARTEGGLGLGLSHGDGPCEVLRPSGDLHAAAAAAGSSLDQHRVADVGRDVGRHPHRCDRRVGSGNTGQAEVRRGPARGNLVAHQPDVPGLGSDEGQAVFRHDLREVGVFRQEADAGMDRVRPGDHGGRQDRGYVEVAVPRRRRPDAHALVGEPDMHGAGIGGRVHGNRLDPHLAAGPVNPQGDVAAVGDEDLLEHYRPADAVTRSPSVPGRTPPAGRW